MDRVLSQDVEDLDSSGLRRERLNVVAENLEVLEESIGRGEAVGHGRGVDRQDWAVLFDQTLVLQAVNEAENVSTCGRGVDSRNSRIKSNADRRAKRLLSVLSVHPAKTIGVNFAILIEESGETSAKVSLETILGCVDSLLGPSGMNFGLSTLNS